MYPCAVEVSHCSCWECVHRGTGTTTDRKKSVHY